MFYQEPTEEELHDIRQFLINDMVTGHMSSIQILRAGCVPDDKIEERVKKRLQQDLNPSKYYKEQFKKADSRVYEETGISVSSLDIYLQIRRDYLLLVETGGLDAFLRAFE